MSNRTFVGSAVEIRTSKKSKKLSLEVAPTTLVTFLLVWPWTLSMTLTYEFHLDLVKTDHRADYLGQRSSYEHTDTQHTRWTDNTTWTSKVVSKQCQLNRWSMKCSGKIESPIVVEKKKKKSTATATKELYIAKAQTQKTVRTQGNRRYQTSPAVCNRTAHFAADTNYNTCAPFTGVCNAMNASFVMPFFR